MGNLDRTSLVMAVLGVLALAVGLDRARLDVGLR
jgi:hypothetical protein